MRPLAIVAVLAASAHAEPRGTYILVPKQERALAAGPSSRIIYLKRCPSGGCVVHFGTVDDSLTQTSTLPDGADKTIGAFNEGDQVWSDLVDCVRTTYSPFNVTVTDVDPGSTVPHFENIVGGQPTDLNAGLTGGVAGVAPFNCGEIANGISYTFDVVGPDAATLCWTAAQETAHVFGLDHEYLQPDPMTYITGGLPKRFQDEAGPCGTFSQGQNCVCPNRATQNSYLMIVGLFGPGAPIVPVVDFTRPTDGKTVQPGFSITITATSIIKIDHVDFYIDGTLAGTVTQEPWTFQPDTLDLGDHTIEVHATDVQGTPGVASETVTMAPPCTPDKGCSNGDVCVMGLCIPGPTDPGGLGAQCTSNDQCVTMQCVNGGDPLMYCGAPCDPKNGASCPHSFTCAADGQGGGSCYPAPDSGGCCNAGGSPRSALVLAGVVALALMRRRRA